MRAASSALRDYLATHNQFLMADLWTLTTKSGFTLRFSSFDRNITYGGNVYPCSDLLVSAPTTKLVLGLEVDEMTLAVAPNKPRNVTVNGTPFLQAVRQGVLNRAEVTRDRLFMPSLGDYSLGALRLFTGEICDVEATGIVANLKVKSLPNLLNINMPRRLIQASCPYTFGSAECGVPRASATSTVLAGSTINAVLCGLTNASYFFNSGVLRFTSGCNAGISRTVRQWSPGVANLSAPFPNLPQAGDAFTIYTGCSKALSADNRVPFAPATGHVSGSVSTTTVLLYSDSWGFIFARGTNILFLSGANAPIITQVATSLPGKMTLSSALPYSPADGDRFIVDYNGGWNQSLVFSIISLPLTTVLPTDLPQPPGYYNGGIVRFSTGPNSGQTRTVAQWTAGTMTLSSALPTACAPGDTFTITPPTDITTSSGQTCAGHSNTLHFGGAPYVPVPETAY